MIKSMKKSVSGILTFLLVFSLCLPVQAASKYTGTYSKVNKNYYSAQRDYINPTYSVIINKVTKKKVRFQVEYLGRNGSPIYETKVITAKRKGKNVSFIWEDTWGNSGNGKLKLKSGFVKIKMTQTKTASMNRASLATNGFIKIKKKSNKNKVYVW